MNNEVVLVPKTMNTANNATNKTMITLSCLSHVKRNTDGHRPPAPPAYVLLSAVVDRSGSMASMGNVPATGLRDFIAEHKKLAKEGNIIKFSLTTFDNVAETWYNGVDLATMPDISAAEMTKMVAPRGLTLLVDTFMQRLHALERQVVNTVNSLPRATRDLKPKIIARHLFTFVLNSWWAKVYGTSSPGHLPKAPPLNPKPRRVVFGLRSRASGWL